MAKKTLSPKNVVAEVRRRLNEAQGTWPSIARAARIPYGTLEKIGQGHTHNPRLSTLEKLLGHFGLEMEIRDAR